MSMLLVRRCAHSFRPARCLLLAALPSLLALPLRGGEPPQGVPLKQVVLFTSGVGYFERRGEVDGDVQLDLRFNVEDINDLLMSMVVQDLGGGKISTVSYASQEPLNRTLQTFRIDLTSEPTLGDLLRQIRGERVQLELDRVLSGVILGIELRPQPKANATGEYIETETLNLLTEDGLESVPLDKVRRVKLLDPALDAELRKALTVVAASHSNDKRAVTLSFEGEGTRPVRVGYVQEAPLWKTSYRLVLTDDKPSLLQGWAIVENTTEEDWANVDLTLVSGRPISFLMDLYQSLYVRRPVVQPEVFAGLVSKVHDQDLAGRETDFRRQAMGGGGMGGMGGGMGGGGGFFGGGGGRGQRDEPRVAPMDPGQGVEASATAGEVGELFHYDIERPVSLPRQKSAMLPIVNQPVEAAKLSLFNARTHPRHPLNALRLKNTTGLHLMQGPITVYEGGSYAGNTRILDLQPETSRLVTYALDLDVEVNTELDQLPDALVMVKISKGIVTSNYTQRRTQHWTVKNSGSRARQVLIERPVEAGWQLLTPDKPAEQTRDLQRFAVLAEPGVPAQLELIDEQSTTRETAVDTLLGDAARFYLSQPVVSDAFKAALADLARRHQAQADLAALRRKAVQELESIDQEQKRIRQNMGALEKSSELYKRFVKKIGEQEDRTEALRQEVQELSGQEELQRKELAEHLENLRVE